MYQISNTVVSGLVHFGLRLAPPIIKQETSAFDRGPSKPCTGPLCNANRRNTITTFCFFALLHRLGVAIACAGRVIEGANTQRYVSPTHCSPPRSDARSRRAQISFHLLFHPAGREAPSAGSRRWPSQSAPSVRRSSKHTSPYSTCKLTCLALL